VQRPWDPSSGRNWAVDVRGAVEGQGRRCRREGPEGLAGPSGLCMGTGGSQVIQVQRSGQLQTLFLTVGWKD
jgi:hypothetical protein